MGVNGIYGLSGSGLDVESMVKVGMLSKQSEYEKMQQKFTKNEWKKSEYLDVYNEIRTFNASTLSQYKMSSNMNARAASSANSSVVTATANANAAPMTHYVQVDSLASSAYLIGTQMTRQNNVADSKNLLSSIWYNGITRNDANTEGGTDTATVTVYKADGTTDTKTVNLKDAAMSFSINDGVNGLLGSDDSDLVTASATPDADTDISYSVTISKVATAPEPIKGGNINGVTSESKITNLLPGVFGYSGNSLDELINANVDNTDTAFAFSFGDGITDTKINFTFAELVNTDTTVADFISGLNAKFKEAGLNLNALFTSSDDGTGGSFSLNNSADNPLGEKNAVQISISKGDIFEQIPLGKMVELASTLFAGAESVPGHRIDLSDSNSPFKITGSGNDLTVSYTLKGSNAVGVISQLNSSGGVINTEHLKFDGNIATSLYGESQEGEVYAPSFDINGITVTAKSKTNDTYPNGVKITNTGAQNIVVTYQDLLDGFTLNDLTSKINQQGTNIRATYDSVQDRISFYNSKSGEDNQINIEIGTGAAGSAAANAATFFNALGLKQSSNGVLDKTAKTFNTNTTESQIISQAGKNASVKIDGVAQTLDSNKATVAGVTYTFQNVTEKGSQTTVSVTQDTEAIAKYVQSFVDDYNALLTKLYKWYDEKPNSDYKPLTESQKSGMKEEQIEKWEEKAKAGLLYHDSTLSKVISQIREAVTSNVDGITGKYKNIFSLGISTTGLKGQLTIDKDKLNAALAEDPEAVYNVFAKLDSGEKQYKLEEVVNGQKTGKVIWSTKPSQSGYVLALDDKGAAVTRIVDDRASYNGIAQRLGDVFQANMKSIKTVSGTTADITEDSELNNLLRELQTKMSNFKRMMDAFESKLFKKYDAMEVALASLGSQLNYVTSAFS